MVFNLYDLLEGNRRLILYMQMSFVYLKLDKGQDSTEKLTIFKELILGLIRLGVDFHSREQLGFGAQYVLRSLKASTHANNSGAPCTNLEASFMVGSSTA